MNTEVKSKIVFQLEFTYVYTQVDSKIGFYLRRYLRLLNPAASDLPLGRRCFADLNSQAPALAKIPTFETRCVYIDT